MPDVHTQTPITGNRIDTVLKELGRLRNVKYNRTARQKKRRANKRMADEVGKGEAEGGARRHRRKVQQVDPPDGFQVKFKVRKTGVRMGMEDRYCVTPSGMAVKSKREVDAYFEDIRQARKKARAPAASAVLPPQPPLAMCEVQSGTGRHGLAAAGRHNAVRHGGVDLRRLLGRRSTVFAGVILTGDWITSRCCVREDSGARGRVPSWGCVRRS